MSNFVAGYQASLDKKRYDDAAPMRDIALQEAQMGLDTLRNHKTDEAERKKIIEDATTDPVVKDFDSSDHPQTMDRAPRQMTLDDQLNLYEKLGQHAMKTGKITPDQAMQAHQKIREMDNEGHFDAYNEYRRTGDIGAAVRMFNQRGKKKVDPNAKITEVQKKDPITDQPYTAYSMSDDSGKVQTFDPLQMARESGGAKGFIDSQKTAFESRKVGAIEKREENRAMTEDRRYQEGLDRATREDRKGDQMDRRLSIMEDNNYLRNDKPGTQGGVFGYKMGVLERAAPHLTEMERYKLASGQRNIPAAQMAKWAEDAISRQEKLTGIPLKADERQKKVKQQMDFYRSFTEDGDASGLTPRPGAQPSAPAGGGKDYSRLWGG